MIELPPWGLRADAGTEIEASLVLRQRGALIDLEVDPATADPNTCSAAIGMTADAAHALAAALARFATAADPDAPIGHVR